MTKLLVSVTSVQEALWALEAGVDIIDLKNPSQGALGALPLDLVRDIVLTIDGRKTISATIGDLPMQPHLLAEAVKTMAATGVDIVKVGFSPSSTVRECISAIATEIALGINVVAVLLADLYAEPVAVTLEGAGNTSYTGIKNDFLLSNLNRAGFFGVMLDTFDKKGGNILDYCSLTDISQFISMLHRLNMESGVAGSLRMEHIQQLINLNPGYLGFRGAICQKFERIAQADLSKMKDISILLQKYNDKKENICV